MRTFNEVNELYGFNESPVAGDFIKSSNRDFVNRGVEVGGTLINWMTGKTGTVTDVTSDTITANGMYFRQGDFWEVSLSKPWVVSNDDGPVVDIECRRCGFSMPRSQLVDGLCKVCADKPNKV